LTIRLPSLCYFRVHFYLLPARLVAAVAKKAG